VELANWLMVGSILAGLLLIDLFVVLFGPWWEGIRGFVTPALPPEGITATQFGALAGFTALVSGLNDRTGPPGCAADHGPCVTATRWVVPARPRR
jgi:hypothetical protein